MKKIETFWISTLVALVIGFTGIVRTLSTYAAEKFSALELPGGFPSNTGLLVIWAFLFVLWGIGCWFVYSIDLTPRRKRNIFLNSIILIIGIVLWHFMIFSAVNLSGALALIIASLILAIVVWMMYLVVHRYGGYLFIPMMVWFLYLLYLTIALVVKN